MSATGFWAFLQHWKNCTICKGVRKVTLASRLCATGRQLYDASHKKEEPHAHR